MATNPMQRKARNSFLLGMLLMLVITGGIIALLILQLKNYRDKEETLKKSSVNIYVLNSDVKSGQIITSDLLTQKTVSKDLIPSDAIGDVLTLENYILEDKQGNTISTNNGKMYITIEEKEYEVKQEENTENYYIINNNEKQYIELNSVPVIAKISMNANTVLTRGAVDKGDSTTADDVRKQEYNVIILPTQIQTGDYIDIRLAMPTGQDYIVISKKEATIPEVGGIPSEDTIWINLSEEEILTMNNAIVEAFRTNGAKLYATTYTEAGIQAAATTTYPVSGEVLKLIDADPNIIQRAKEELVKRYNVEQRNNINSIISNNSDANSDNVKTKVDESITNTKDNRKKYLDSLSGGTTAN